MLSLTSSVALPSCWRAPRLRDWKRDWIVLPSLVVFALDNDDDNGGISRSVLVGGGAVFVVRCYYPVSPPNSYYPYLPQHIWNLPPFH